MTIDTKRLRELAEKATQGPLRYRPLEYDDWGYIRGPDDAVFATARAGQDVDYPAHREARTDPYEPNGRLIVEALNALPALLDAYEALCEIAEQDQINLALDPEWPQRIARAALEGKSK